MEGNIENREIRRNMNVRSEVVAVGVWQCRPRPAVFVNSIPATLRNISRLWIQNVTPTGRKFAAACVNPHTQFTSSLSRSERLEGGPLPPSLHRWPSDVQ